MSKAARRLTPGAAPTGPQHLGHRARLRARVLEKGAASLADYELLEFLLFGALPRGDTKPLAKALLARFDGVAAVLAAPPEKLAEVPGMGEASIALLKATAEMGRRLAWTSVKEQPVLSSIDALVGYCRTAFGRAEVEELHLLFLDKKNRLIADEVHQRGTVDFAPVFPREVAKSALALGASALILVHNHPSGDPTPSKADIEMTKSLKSLAEQLGIVLHDHLVVAASGHVSLRESGRL